MPPQPKNTEKPQPEVGPADPPSGAAVQNAAKARVPVTPAADADVPIGDREPVADKDMGRPVTMRDIAALQGIVAAPDASVIIALSVDEARKKGVFISAGMMSDIEQYGYTRSPIDGGVIATDEKLAEARKRRDGK